MVNEVLVAKGYATLATYPPDIAAVDRIRAAQPADARGGAGAVERDEQAQRRARP